MKKLFFLFLLLSAANSFSAYCNAIIRHDNCEFDDRCGLTCQGIIDRELALDPSLAPMLTPEFIDDFLENCALFYWPSGCPSSSSTGEGSNYLELTPGAIDTLVAVFQHGYLGGVLWGLFPFSGIFSVLAVIGLFSHAVKNS